MQLSVDRKNLIVNLYQQGQSSLQIVKTTGHCQSTVLKTIKDFGIDRRDYSHARRKYIINESYFSEINTPNKAYILGFIFADGCVYPPKNALIFGVQSKDIEILKHIKNELQYGGPIKEYPTKNKVVLQIKNKKICEDLLRLGCIHNKSKHLESLPPILNSLLPHFIRGYFDGDGSIFKHYKWNIGYFSILGTKIFIKKIQSILMEQCNLNTIKLYSHRNGTHASFTYGGNIQLTRIYNYLYPLTPDKILFLNRKHTKFLKFIKK